MNIFDMEIVDENLYLLDDVMESLDAKQDVVRAMYSFEMLSIQESSEEALLEATNNVFDKIIAAIKKIFKAVITFVQNMIKAMKDKYRKLQLFLRKKSGKVMSEYKPDFTIFDYSGMPTISLEFITNCMQPYEWITSKHSIGLYCASAKRNGFNPTFEGYRAYLRRMDDIIHKRCYLSLGTSEEAKSAALNAIVDALNHDGYVKNKLYSGEEISDVSAFLSDLPGVFRGNEIEIAEAATALVDVDIVYKNGIKHIENTEKELNIKHHDIVDNMQKLKNTANEIGSGNSGDIGAQDAFNFAMRLANTVTNNVNVALKLAMNVVNIYSQVLDEQMKQAVRILDETNTVGMSAVFGDSK